ncbi:MAG: DUF423 domain-containing protein, partial [Bacteroidota bacterium]
MMRAERFAALGGAILGLSVVLIGASLTHDMHAHYDLNTIRSYDTAARYQMYHALGLLIVAALGGKLRSKLFRIIPYLWFVGTVLFSVPIYLNVFAGIRSVGILTPIGGVLLIIG